MTKPFPVVRDRVVAYRFEHDLSWGALAAVITELCGVTISARVLNYVCTNLATMPSDRTQYKLTRFVETIDRPPPVPRRRRRAARAEDRV